MFFLLLKKKVIQWAESVFISPSLSMIETERKIAEQLFGFLVTWTTCIKQFEIAKYKNIIIASSLYRVKWTFEI